jgi:zinc finger CCCH domain-containing protein 13
VGSEYIKKVETYYCNLCRIYLDNRDMKEALSRHCGTRSHLQRYVRYRDHKQLVEEAEKLHRSNQEKRAAAKAATAKKTTTSESGDNAEVVIKKEPNESPKKTATTTTATNDDDKESDEKMWESVDKDLGDLLREVAPEVADEDEDGDDSRNNTERCVQIMDAICLSTSFLLKVKTKFN